jgi:transcriptional regulator with GAF, ATPase, and Fis domain
MERAVLLADGRAITPDAIPLGGTDTTAPWEHVPDDARALVEAKKELRAEAVERLEKAFVLKALRGAQWSVTGAARAVGMQRPNFHALMRKYGITTPRGTPAEDEEESLEESV